MSDGDYEEFYLGRVKVVQADRAGFTVYGMKLPRVWIARGQVHIKSDMEEDVGEGAIGYLTVTRWFALSRNLHEDLTPRPPPEQRRTTSAPKNVDSQTRKSSPSSKPEGFRSRSSEKAAASSKKPEGFQSRSSGRSQSPQAEEPERASAPSSVPEGFTSRTGRR